MSSSNNNTTTAKRLSYPIYHKYLSGATCAEQSNVNVILERLYRPQGKVMFSEACVVLFTEGGCAMSLPVWSHVPSREVSSQGSLPLGGVSSQVVSFRGSPPRRSGYSLVLTSSGSYCSGRYASYCNAFFFGYSKSPMLQD